MVTTDGGTSWLKRFRPGTSELRLFCFHHAGGAASTYRSWARSMPPFVESLAVQLPGRAERLAERPFEDMSCLVETLVDVVSPYLDQPFSFYGLSMGGSMAWALTHALRDRGLPTPSTLYLTNVGTRPIRERRDWRAVSDEDLIGYLRAMGGTPDALFDEPELLATVLPTLRADLVLVDSFDFSPRVPLTVPIHAFAGVDDADNPAEHMQSWREMSTGHFDLQVLPDGHFLGEHAEAVVIQAITADLWRLRAETHATP